jgi:hypothetical protein
VVIPETGGAEGSEGEISDNGSDANYLSDGSDDAELYRGIQEAERLRNIAGDCDFPQDIDSDSDTGQPDDPDHANEYRRLTRDQEVNQLLNDDRIPDITREALRATIQRSNVDRDTRDLTMDSLADLLATYLQKKRESKHLKVHSRSKRGRGKKLTLRESEVYRWYEKSNQLDLRFVQPQLLQHDALVSWARLEDRQLDYLMKEQRENKTRRVTMQQAMGHTGAANDIGSRVILTKRHMGSPRYKNDKMHQWMQYLQQFGHPTYFVTMTCNSQWEEFSLKEVQGIQLYKNVPASKKTNLCSERPDITARVWHLKSKQFLDFILSGKVFGKVKAHVAVHEWQKEGLPHMHLILWMDDSAKPATAEDVDRNVTAVLPPIEPNPFGGPSLHDLVTSFQLHGPCAEKQCTKNGFRSNGKCQKHFPMDFAEETTYAGPGNDAQYARPDDGTSFTKPRGDYVFNNRNVVPYNAILTMFIRAHCNVELCQSSKSIKYLVKYLTKETSSFSTKVISKEGDAVNEILNYLDSRKMGSHETMHRLYGFPLNHSSHACVQLPVHLPGQQVVFITDSTDLQNEEVRRDLQATGERSKLLKFFEFNKVNATKDNFMPCTFENFVHWHSWGNGNWHRRRSKTEDTTIGYMQIVTMKQGELFFLRLLLKHVIAPESYESLRTVIAEDGAPYVCPTFAEAAERRGLCLDERHITKSLEEIALISEPRQLRMAFAMCISNSPCQDRTALWEKHKAHLCEDYMKRLTIRPLTDPIPLAISNYALLKIEKHMECTSLKLQDFGLAPPEGLDAAAVDAAFSELTGRDLFHRQQKERNRAQNYVLTHVNNVKKSPGQSKLYDKLVNLVEERDAAEPLDSNLHFVDAPAGTGKTYVFNLFINKLVSMSKKVIVVASSGIAASLLFKGATAHSTFKIPLKCTSTSFCNIEADSALAKQIAEADVIIWDEAPLMSYKVFQTVERTIATTVMRNSPKPFGGKLVIFGGDFRQCLPVTEFDNSPYGGAGICLKKATFWKHVKCHYLRGNQRITQHKLAAEADAKARGEPFDGGIYDMWEEMLLRYGNGTEPPPAGADWETIEVPDFFLSQAKDFREFLFSIYPEEIWNDHAELAKRSIITPLHKDVDIINDTMKDIMRETIINSDRYSSASDQDRQKLIRDYQSVNYALGVNGDRVSKPEFDAYDHPSLPPRLLQLHVGAPVQLLRNFNGYKGLANGTKCIVKELHEHFIILEVVSGTYRNQSDRRVTFCLPKVRLESSEAVLGMHFVRETFPIKLSYAITVHKAQGQTIKRVGIYLPSPSFSHGMWYTSTSRVQSFEHLQVFIPEPPEDSDLPKYYSDDNRLLVTTLNRVCTSLLQQEADHLFLDV